MEIINYDNKVSEINMKDIIFHGTDIKDYNYIAINWKLLDGCNYKCSYCFGQEALSKKDFIDISKLKKAVDKIFQIDKEFYHFTIVGGEPTYYPNFLELIEYIYSYNKKISTLLISNASRNIEYFEKLLSYVGQNTFRLLFSIHLEYMDLEHIKDLVILFNKYKQNITLKLMLHPEYKEKIYQYFDELIKLKASYIFDFTLEELREPPDFNKTDSRYDKDFFNWIDNSRKKIAEYKNNSFPDNSYEYLTYYEYLLNNEKKNIKISHNISLRNNLKQFKDFYCCGGITLIKIFPNGRYQGAVCSVFPIIGNIYDDNDIDLYKLSNFVKCPFEQCGCDSNDRINKYRNINEAKKYVLNYRKKYPKVMMEYMLNTIEELKKDINSNNKINDITSKTSNSEIKDISSNLNNIEEQIKNINSKMNNTDKKISNVINSLAWWIPFKKKRDEFRKKFDV